MTTDDLKNRFSFHPAKTEEVGAKHGAVRDWCFELARFLNEVLPEGREKSLAITKLEEAMMWSNAAIAREPEKF